MDKPTFKITDFEGPLDLLLHLISKHKLNSATSRSRSFWSNMWFFLSIRGAIWGGPANFWRMAARLVHIKTMMLLPRHEKEGEALKTELQNELAEYRVCQLWRDAFAA
jgi:segregation and condensation protein A